MGQELNNGVRTSRVLAIAAFLSGLGAGTLAYGQQANPEKPAATVRSLPSNAEISNLVRTTLLAVNAGTSAGDYEKLYSQLTPDLQKSVDSAKLKAALQTFKDKNIDLTEITRIEPTFSTVPLITTGGLLAIEGGYNLKTRAVRFKINYSYVNNAWRISAIDVDSPNDVVPSSSSSPLPATSQTVGRGSGGDLNNNQNAVPIVPQGASAAPNANQNGNMQPAAAASGRFSSPFLDWTTDPPTTTKW